METVWNPHSTWDRSTSQAGVYNQIDQLADLLDCGIVIVHHTSKGVQSEKRVTDVGSGAGSLSRAVDTHLVLREHEQDDHVVLEGAVRSFAPINPLVLRWEFPVWTVANGLDTTKLKRSQKRIGIDRRTNEGKAAIVSALTEHGELSGNKLRRFADIGSKGRADRLTRILEKEGTIASRQETIKRNLTTLYRLPE